MGGNQSRICQSDVGTICFCIFFLKVTVINFVFTSFSMTVFKLSFFFFFFSNKICYLIKLLQNSYKFPRSIQVNKLPNPNPNFNGNPIIPISVYALITTIIILTVQVVCECQQQQGLECADSLISSIPRP